MNPIVTFVHDSSFEKDAPELVTTCGPLLDINSGGTLSDVIFGGPNEKTSESLHSVMLRAYVFYSEGGIAVALTKIDKFEWQEHPPRLAFIGRSGAGKTAVLCNSLLRIRGSVSQTPVGIDRLLSAVLSFFVGCLGRLPSRIFGDGHRLWMRLFNQTESSLSTTRGGDRLGLVRLVVAPTKGNPSDYILRLGVATDSSVLSRGRLRCRLQEHHPILVTPASEVPTRRLHLVLHESRIDRYRSIRVASKLRKAS